jgi:hypothetical protein
VEGRVGDQGGRAALGCANAGDPPGATIMIPPGTRSSSSSVAATNGAEIVMRIVAPEAPDATLACASSNRVTRIGDDDGAANADSDVNRWDYLNAERALWYE